MSIDSNLLVGNDKLDAKHLEIFELLELFSLGVVMADDRERLTQQLTVVQKYVIDCFTYEEELLRRYKHPRYFDHRRQHRLYVESIMVLKAEIERHGHRAPAAQNPRALAQWLEGHIIEHDRDIPCQGEVAV